MSAAFASSESFPHLTKFLENLRSGLKQFGFSEIQDLLRGRHDRDFNKKAAQKSRLLKDSINEIQKKCIDLTYAPDPGHIKFLLWKRISRAVLAHSSAEWKAETIGRHVIAQLRAPDQERLVCLPLFGSVAPWRKEPRLYPLAHGVWLIEPSRSLDRLVMHFEALLGRVPTEMETELRKLDEPAESEFGALLFEPLVAYRTKGFFSEHAHALWRYGLPLIALHNIVTINTLDTSDDLSLLYYMMKYAPPGWSEKLQREWKMATDDPLALEVGLTEPCDTISVAEASTKIWSYDVHLKDGSISPVHWSSEALTNRPPLLILPSLVEGPTTAKLINYGFELSQEPRTDLDRRLAHAALMWTKASRFVQEWGLGRGL